MEAPPAVAQHVVESRHPFIVVVKNCEPGSSKKAYGETVLELLKANDIHQQPKAVNHYSCSFIINLLQEEHIRLSNSPMISHIDPDHELTIQ